jgi:nucleotide-binding universal stress UspA family protein
MKTIIVATDFSDASYNAAQYAANMALGVHANLLLLHVFQMPLIYAQVPMAVSGESVIQVAANENHLKQNAEKNIQYLKNELSKRTGSKIDIETEIRYGVFFDELKAVCEIFHPYAVVMGSQGTTAATRLFFGEHTVYATKNLKWPLITVPVDTKYLTVKHIALACDFDESIDITPFDEIKMLVSDLDASLHILNIGKKDVFNPEVYFESNYIIEKLASVKPEYHFITAENIDEAIIAFVDKNNIDLLMILPKRHDLLDKLMHRSHTKQLVLHSHVPVMSLHH